MTEPVIRDIAPTDLDAILTINQANVPEVGPVDAERLAFIVNESAIALVASVDDVVAGFCLVLAPASSYDSVNYRWFMERHPDAMYLDRVAIDATFRGRGLGSLLYADVDRAIEDRFDNACSLTLEVNVDPPNEASLRFHDRLGLHRSRPTDVEGNRGLDDAPRRDAAVIGASVNANRRDALAFSVDPAGTGSAPACSPRGPGRCRRTARFRGLRLTPAPRPADR